MNTEYDFLFITFVFEKHPLFSDTHHSLCLSSVTGEIMHNPTKLSQIWL